MFLGQKPTLISLLEVYGLMAVLNTKVKNHVDISSIQSHGRARFRMSIVNQVNWNTRPQ